MISINKIQELLRKTLVTGLPRIIFEPQRTRRFTECGSEQALCSSVLSVVYIFLFNEPSRPT